MRPTIVRATLFLSLLCSTPLFAQERLAPVALEVPASVRAAALGGAFVLGSVDADAIFYNAAFGESLRGISASAHLFGRPSSLVSVSGGMEWWGASVGLGLQTTSYADGGRTALRAEDDLFNTMGDAVAEQIASLAYARRVKGIRFGATAKWIEQRTNEARSSSFAADLSAGMTVGPVQLGLAVQNLGPALPVVDEERPLPNRATLGASLARPWIVGPIDVLATAATGRDAYGDFFGGGGVEVSYWPITGRTFTLRGGLRSVPSGMDEEPLTLGAGYTGDRISLDWAWQSFGPLGYVNRFGVRWR
jgi:hypothetical protein